MASSSAPALHVPVRGWSEPDEQLVTYLRDLGGTPWQLFDDPDLLALFLLSLRADLTVIGTCPANDEPPLATPVRAFAGAQDTEGSPARTLAWRQETTTASDLDVVAGGYFFTPEGTRQVLESIAKDLSRADSPVGSA